MILWAIELWAYILKTRIRCGPKEFGSLKPFLSGFMLGPALPVSHVYC